MTDDEITAPYYRANDGAGFVVLAILLAAFVAYVAGLLSGVGL